MNPMMNRAGGGSGNLTSLVVRGSWDSYPTLVYNNPNNKIVKMITVTIYGGTTDVDFEVVITDITNNVVIGKMRNGGRELTKTFVVDKKCKIEMRMTEADRGPHKILALTALEI